MQETRVRSPGQEDPLEEEMATHSSIVAWRIPRTGVTELDTTEQLNHHQPPGDSDGSGCAPRYSIMSNCDPMDCYMDCSPSDSYVHGISQARILEWVAMPSSRGSSQLKD